MLDQNTDRMWYVIGAVIIGAAIILIPNKTFPQLFASVGDTFKDKTEQTTSVVDGILPQTKPGKNYLLDTATPKTSIGPEYIDYYLDVTEFNELSGNKVIVSFDAKAEVDGVHYIDTYFRVHDGTIRTFNMSEDYALTSEYQRFTYVMDIPDFTDYLEYEMSLRFRGNIYVPGAGSTTGSQTNTNAFTTRNVKMELGTTDTGYVPHEDEKTTVN